MTDSEKLDLLLEKMGTIEQRMNSMEKEMNSMKNGMDSMEKEINSMKNGMHSMAQDICELKEDMASVKIRIEDELCVNIQRVAEGHLDLSRNLHDAMKPSKEVEMLAIKVRMLESEVKYIKQKIS